MNPRWFRENICEELEGACNYIKCAIESMKTHPSWSEQFYKMAEQEQGHATDLYKMFMDMYTDLEEPDSYMKASMEGIMECFSKYMKKLEDHKVTYEMMLKKEEKMSEMKDLERLESRVSMLTDR